MVKGVKAGEKYIKFPGEGLTRSAMSVKYEEFKQHQSKELAVGQNLSIHGYDRVTGKRGDGVYNPNPQEPKTPTTARGKRRAEVGRGVKNTNRPSKKANVKKH